MGTVILTFVKLKLKTKNKFYHHKTPISLKDVDIEKVLASKKSFSDEKKL